MKPALFTLQKAVYCLVVLGLSSCAQVDLSWPPEKQTFPIHIIGPVYQNETREPYHTVNLLTQAIAAFAGSYNRSANHTAASGFTNANVHNWLLKGNTMNRFWRLVDGMQETDRLQFDDSLFRMQLIDFFEAIEFKGYLLALRFSESKESSTRILEGFRIIYRAQDEFELNPFQIPVQIDRPDISEALTQIVAQLAQSLDYSSPGFGPMGFTRITAGCFNPAQSGDRLECVDEFYLSRFPVTSRQWNAVMNPSATGTQPENDLPVVFVSWNAVMGFIETLNETANRTYRLPSSLEWEYACSGDTTKPDSPSPLSPHSTRSSQIEQSKSFGLKPVDARPPNRFGLFDMRGNTWEWTSDQTLKADHQGFFLTLLDTIRPAPPNRVICGDSYSSLDSEPSCASEKHAPASIGAADIGFRLVLEH